MITRKCRLRRLGRLLCSLFLMVITVGCGKSDGCTAEDVRGIIEDYFDGDYSGYAESSLKKSYNSLSTEKRKRLKVFFDACAVTVSSGEDGSSFDIRIDYPDVNGILGKAGSDVGLRSAVESGKLLGYGESAFSGLVWEYVTQSLSGADQLAEEFSITVVQAGEKYCIADDGELFAMASEFLTTDVTAALPQLGEAGESDGGTQISAGEAEAGVPVEYVEFDPESMQTVREGQSFIFSVEGSRLLATVVSIRGEQEAMSAIAELSSANESLRTKDMSYYVEYTVKNLSKKDVLVYNCFRGVTGDGTLLMNSGNFVYGTVEATEVRKGETEELSAFIVCPSDARIVWYNADVSGNYVLDVVK